MTTVERLLGQRAAPPPGVLADIPPNAQGMSGPTHLLLSPILLVPSFLLRILPSSLS